jgi:hypothetical protein
MIRQLTRGFALVLAIGGAACSSQTSPAAPTPAAAGAATAADTAPFCNPDTTKPIISGVSASPNTLWPPNHKWWTIAVNYTATDNCSGAITTALSVASDEAINGLGDGNTSPDWQVVNAHTVQLRAERSGTADGRVYTIAISATDAAGNITTSTVQVTVAHDQGKK